MVCLAGISFVLILCIFSAAAITPANHYDLLGIGRSASFDEIKRAFRRMAMKYHPDRNAATDAQEMFCKLVEAYETLIDARKRREYDQETFYENAYSYKNDFFDDYEQKFNHQHQQKHTATFGDWFDDILYTAKTFMCKTFRKVSKFLNLPLVNFFSPLCGIEFKEL